jgi:signal transduction histidine kinase
VNAPDQAVGAGHATDGRVCRDPAGQARLRQLAEEQSALRRVAMLVAQGTSPEQVFAAVAEEVGGLLEVDYTVLIRSDPEDMITVVGGWTATGVALPSPVGSRFEVGGRNVSTLTLRTGRPARLDAYVDVTGSIGNTGAHDWGFRSSVGAPISVEGEPWGLILVAYTRDQHLPADTEARLASFTELVATAIANAESRASLARLAKEQAALRRVATLVANGATPEQVFAAVTEEFARLVPVDVAAMARYEPDGTQIFVASWGRAVDFIPIGSRWTLDGKNIATTLFETGRPIRVESQAGATGSLADLVRDMGVRSLIGTTVVVEGRLWGSMGAGSTLEEPLPPDAETRLASFTELVATAIANADSRAQLMASRARIVAAADETRRRIERDLHDGTQQQLATLILDLGGVQAEAPPGLEGGLSRIAGRVADVLDQVREISRGIHPSILSELGLRRALKALGRRSAVPVELDLRAGRRLPGHVEVAVYYAVSEALANATKHAHASVVQVELDIFDATLRLAIRDDGIGGADPARGSGLIGLRDRIEAVGGTFDVTSPADGGTTLSSRSRSSPVVSTSY